MHLLEKLKENETLGACMLIYGPTGAGKTDSAITGIDRILYMNKEPKDARLVHAGRDPKYADRIDYAEFDGFYDEIAYLNGLLDRYTKGERPYETIFHDGITFAMVNNKRAVADDRHRANMAATEKAEKATKKKAEERGPENLVDRFRIEKPDWGTVADMTAREVYLLNQLSKFGILCVSTAIDQEYPKWNQSVRVAPSLTGQEFSKQVHGYFDFIGYLSTPYHVVVKKDLDGKVISSGIVTPCVSFISPDDGMSSSYMARCNSMRLTQAELKAGPPPLNLSLIMQVIRGQKQI